MKHKKCCDECWCDGNIEGHEKGLEQGRNKTLADVEKMLDKCQNLYAMGCRCKECLENTINKFKESLKSLHSPQEGGDVKTLGKSTQKLAIAPVDSRKGVFIERAANITKDGIKAIRAVAGSEEDWQKYCKEKHKGCGKIIRNEMAMYPVDDGWQCGQYYDALKTIMLCSSCKEKK